MSDDMRTDIAFNSDGTILRGWFDRPAGSDPVPAIIATHGLGSTIDFLEPLAAELVAAGFGVLAFDHRGLGRSDGEPRQEVEPWRQVQDTRNAVSFLRGRPDVDGTAIGLWGASMGGGVAVTAAATDARVAAVAGVSLVASGWHASLLMTPEADRPAFDDALDADRRRRLAGFAAATVPVMPELSEEEVAASTDPSVRFMHPRAKASPTFRPYLTLRSLEHIRDFEPVAFAHRLAGRPVLLIVASDDRLAPVADARRFLELVDSDRKELLIIEGHHYVPLDEALDETAAATIGFFRQHLSRHPAPAGVSAAKDGPRP